MSLFSHIDELRQGRRVFFENRRADEATGIRSGGGQRRPAALAGEKPDLHTLQAVFSRSGFTDGYFTGKLGPGMFGTRQKEDVTAASPALLKDLRGFMPRKPGG